MNEIGLIYRQELKAFLKSGKSSILLVFFTVFVWGSIISDKVDSINSWDSILWVMFFALVAGAALCTTTFIRERLSSTLEVLILSGVERTSILYGKLLFTTTTTLFIGMTAFFVAFVIRVIFLRDAFLLFSEVGTAFLLFGAASLLVSSSTAFLSMALSNPRLVQFINITLLSVLSVAYTALSQYFGDSILIFSSVLILLSFLFSRLALRMFRSEKILQPLIY